MSHMSSDLMFCQKDIVNLHIVCVFLCIAVTVCVRERERQKRRMLFVFCCCFSSYTDCSVIFLDHKNQVCHRLEGATSWGTRA